MAVGVVAVAVVVVEADAVVERIVAVVERFADGLPGKFAVVVGSAIGSLAVSIVAVVVSIVVAVVVDAFVAIDAVEPVEPAVVVESPAVAGSYPRRSYNNRQFLHFRPPLKKYHSIKIQILSKFLVIFL